jgi:hypothetical protein
MSRDASQDPSSPEFGRTWAEPTVEANLSDVQDLVHQIKTLTGRVRRYQAQIDDQNQAIAAKNARIAELEKTMAAIADGANHSIAAGLAAEALETR